MSSLRPPPVDGSSSSPESMSTAFMSANVSARLDDADMDGEHDDDDDLLLKDDSSSPSPESEKPAFVERRPPSKFPPGASRRIPNTQGGRSASSVAKTSKGPRASSGASSSKNRASPGPGNPVIPRRAEDWEPWKSILHELYITQNRILRDIIVIMETNYNVRATPKMYKNQFARWNFFKYAIKRRPRGRTQPGGGGPQETTALVTSRRSPGTVEGLVSPLLYESSKARVMQAGMATVRDFLQVYINLDPTARDDKVVFGYEDPCFRYFKTSMDLFDQKENMHGGLLLRRAFLQIETMLSTMTIKAFSDLCFLVPHLLIESRRLDILGAYLRYLSGLAMAKFGNHPISDVVATLAELADEPETLMRYIMALSEVNWDTLTNLGDAQERTRRWARYQYLACQKTDLDLGGASNDKDRKHAHHMLRVESQSVYWAQHLVMNDPESDKLAELWMVRDFPEDFVPRCEAYIAKAKALGESKLLPPGYARMMECLYIGWLNDYYETMEDWERVFEYGRRGLALAGGEQYQIWSIHLEGLMREHGSEKEAEELRKKRLAHQWFDEVREAVEKLTISLN